MQSEKKQNKKKQNKTKKQKTKQKRTIMKNESSIYHEHILQIFNLLDR